MLVSKWSELFNVFIKLDGKVARVNLILAGFVNIKYVINKF